MKKLFPLLFCISIFFSCAAQETGNLKCIKAKKEIGMLLDSWHMAAAKADFEKYFGKMTDDAVFIGTDASENWTLEEFKAYSKPFFEKGQAWTMTASDRNIYISDSGKIAWFDELLNSSMGMIRGSGVAVMDNGEWKIQHYVLSYTIPNELAKEVTELKRN
ncbi:MAG TPA: nuclear transport factor 2 family protein [Salinimicrobium sp.]|nr:nuclear transport factor 2 family protein [Salinimicrobium sp.]